MRVKNIIIKLLAAIFWIIVWQILAMAVGMTVLLPSPLETFTTLCDLVVTAEFWLSCAMSIYRILSGLLTGAIAAVLLASLTHVSTIAYNLFSPILTVIKATPVASFILLSLIWIGREKVPSFMTFLVVLPIIWSSVHHSISRVDQKLIEITDVFQFTKAQKLRHLYIPSVFPAFLSSFMTSVGIAWKAGVAAEVLATPKFSIGKSIFESKKYIETTELFAWTATVIVLSLIIEKLLLRVCLWASERSTND